MLGKGVQIPPGPPFSKGGNFWRKIGTNLFFLCPCNGTAKSSRCKARGAFQVRRSSATSQRRKASRNAADGLLAKPLEFRVAWRSGGGYNVANILHPGQ